MKRILTTEEINEILSIFDHMYLGLYERARNCILENLKEPLRARLQQLSIDPCYISLIKAKLARAYQEVEAGTSVGILTAQSVGEMQTQMNLNIFHQAGYRDKQVEHASRLQELTCTSKSETQSFVVCKIYFTLGYSYEQMLSMLTYMTLDNYILSYEIAHSGEQEVWERHFLTCFNINFNIFEYKYVTTYKLNIELMYKFRVTLAFIAAQISNIHSEIIILFSPLYMGKIKIYARTVAILRACHKTAHEVYIHGIQGIVQAYFMPTSISSNELYIETEGTNLREIYKLPFVDSYTTMSNDMWEIYDIFGIEAVRAFLVEEFTSIMPSVHFSHIELLADRMTVSGKLRSITRYTRKNEHKASVLSKITFEETLKRSVDAAFKEQNDNMRGCSSSVICGKLPSIGTGMNELLFDFTVTQNID